jgi:hypothetical protein
MNRSLDFSTWLGSASATFATTLTGLAFETIPFLLLGTLLSAIIGEFVPDRALRRIFPHNKFLSILVALVVGVFVPICECGTVPLARRLREKGLPISTAVAFLLAAPLANPMTIVSTYVAFKGAPFPMWALRLGLGLGAAALVAIVVELLSRSRSIDVVDPPRRFRPVANTAIARPPLLVRPVGREGVGLIARAAATLEHCSYDFLDSVRYLIAGISVAALARAIVPAEAFSGSLARGLPAIGTGLGSAYFLSLCSSADAFVSRSLFAPASYPAALSFLILGPMIDLKNTILLSRFVKPRMLVSFIVLIALASCAATLAASPMIGGMR